MTEDDFENNLEMVSFIAKALGDKLEDVVFVGGSVVALYIDIKGVPEPAPSVDLDCIVEILNRPAYNDFREVLRGKGFKDLDPSDDSDFIPTCRMYYEKLKVDIMPIEESVLGYANPFYKEGIKNKVLRRLPDNTEIFILPLPYFVATKLRAFYDRGVDDPLFSQDLEDIVSIMDGASTFVSEIQSSDSSVQEFINDSFSEWIKNWENVYREAIEANLAYRNKTEKVSAIKEKLKEIISHHKNRR